MNKKGELQRAEVKKVKKLLIANLAEKKYSSKVEGHKNIQAYFDLRTITAVANHIYNVLIGGYLKTQINGSCDLEEKDFIDASIKIYNLDFYKAVTTITWK